MSAGTRATGDEVDAAGRPARPKEPPRVRRHRVLARLREAAGVPVVVLTAPAGSGKSVAAAQWCAEVERYCATVRLAPHRDNPAALAASLTAALNAVGPVAPGTKLSITAVEPAFSAVVLPELTALAASRGQPYLLVLDDVQLLTHPDCDRVLAAVCDAVPSGSQVALLTRGATPLWLSRARAEGRVVEIDADELAFDDGEAAGLCAALGVDIRPSEVAALVHEYEGWAVGLYLAATARRGQSWPPGDLRPRAPRGQGRPVLDYIRAEVLAGHDEDTQQFLRRTSIVEEVTAGLGNAVTQRQDAAAVLARTQRDNQLVLPLAGGGYRYHHLLREALREELQRREPQLQAQLHARAAAWYERAGDLDAAIRHATAAGDDATLARLVWRGVPGCVGTGHPDRLAGWLDPLGEWRIAADPWLTLAAAWLGLQTGDQDRTTRWTLGAEAHAGTGWEERAGTQAYAASLATLHALLGTGGLVQSHRFGVAAAAGLPPDSPFRTPALFLSGVSASLRRQDDEARALLTDAQRLCRALNVPVVEADALSWLGVSAGLSGDWESAAPLLERAGTIITDAFLDRLATGAHCVSAQALFRAVRGERTRARALLATARRLTTLVRGISPWFRVYGPLLQARAALLLGDADTARTLYLDAKSHLTPDLAGTVLEERLAELRAELTQHSFTGVPAVALTSAELAVLQFMPSHLTFRQIGEQLFIASTTVKSHALSIYRKLGVRSRDEAVTRARSLGLVGSLRLD
ncbi:MAG: LuxR C-terminal-related transcriptional regulator [Dermatophilaceae bacterium]